MELRRQIDIPVDDYQPGEHVFGPYTVSGRVDGVFVRLQRNTVENPDIWPSPSVELEVLCEVQDPGPPGGPWDLAGSVKDSGGPKGYGGHSFSTWDFMSYWDGEQMNKRPARVRLRFVVTGGVCRTGGRARFWGLAPGEQPQP